MSAHATQTPFPCVPAGFQALLGDFHAQAGSLGEFDKPVFELQGSSRRRFPVPRSYSATVRLTIKWGSVVGVYGRCVFRNASTAWIGVSGCST